MMSESAEHQRLRVPGRVIHHSPAGRGKYVGSPSIIIAPGGHYIASHDYFGPGTLGAFDTYIYRSDDCGESWRCVAELKGQFWSNLFVHRNQLYILGTTGARGNIVIRRSDDGGMHWTVPLDEHTGLLASDEGYHCAPMPVAVFRGRIWRAFEQGERNERGGWRGRTLRALAISAEENADLLQAANWTFTNRVPHPGRFLRLPPKKDALWREGNMIVDVERGQLLNMIRYEASVVNLAAMLRVDDEGCLRFEPESGVIDFPGGRNKFTIRYDEQTKLYWSLTNPLFNDDPRRDIEAGGLNRNIVALILSDDLRQWEIKHIVLQHPGYRTHAFQYLDWQFDGEDLIAVSRTAFEDERGGPEHPHDANFMTFHRISGFRAYRDYPSLALYNDREEQEDDRHERL